MLSFARRAAVFLLSSLSVGFAVELPRGLPLEGANIHKLTIGDAVEMVLRNNLEVEFDRIDIKIEAARRRFAAGEFDPILSASATRESAQRPDITTNLNNAESLLQQAQIVAIQENTNAILIANGFPPNPILDPSIGRIVIFDQDADRYEASLGFRTPFGTQAAITARQSKIRSTFEGDTREIIPFYQAFGGIEIRQPLLKNFGFAANLADVRVARISEKVAELNWRKSISDAITATLGNYFDMLYAQEDLRVRQNAVAAGQKLVQQNQRRMELGFMSPIDVQQARAQVSQDVEAEILAQNTFMERQFALRRLITREAEQTKESIFMPTETPNLKAPPRDRSALLSTAFQNRNDYLAAVTDAEKQDIRLRFARNQLWPTLDVVGTYGFNGLATEGYDLSRDEAAANQAPQWTLGIRFSVPLGSVQPRAQLDAIKGFKEQAIVRIKQSEKNVTVDVDTALSRIETNRASLTAARQTRELNEEAVRIGYKRLEEGQISSFDLIELQRRVYNAHSRELAARADLNKAIVTLWHATGTIFDQMGIEVIRTGKRGGSVKAIQVGGLFDSKTVPVARAIPVAKPVGAPKRGKSPKASR
ncbi:MAG: TolC family protein [Chthoniobacteraceae bacterium]